MKALAHRLRGRRASRREHDDVESSEDDVARPEAKDWRRHRGLNSKTGSCNQLAALAAASSSSADTVPPSFTNAATGPTVLAKGDHERQIGQQRLVRGGSNSRVNAASALRPHAQEEQSATCITSSSSSGHSAGSSGSRSRSRHGGSMCSNASAVSAYQKPEVAVDVRHKGYLLIKRGLLKVADKRFYFVARRSPELYSCKDETSFSLWLASGRPLDPHGGDELARASGLSPVLVGTVLRADAAEEAAGNHPGRLFSVMVNASSKCITLRLAAESTVKATAWLEALQEIQVTQRDGSEQAAKLPSASDKKLLLPLNEHNALRATRADSATASECSASEQGDADGVGSALVEDVPHGDEDNDVVTRPASASNAKMPRAYAAGKLQSKPQVVEEEATASTPTSHTDSSPTSASVAPEHAETALPPVASPAAAQLPPHPRMQRMDSVASCSSTASGQSQGSNNGVLLFVPVAGSSLTASASRMAKAQQELDALVAKGAKLPPRVMDEPSNGEKVAWRYGVPEYVLTDLAYVKGRLREPETTPLASYVEECCQTFIMEATHKARYDQWHSVCQDSFYLQVNDGERVSGASILENDMLGLLYLGGIDPEADGDENQDPRAELAEAFPDGFPMEVLEVFTQPPQCYFSWRHWGPFSGKYRGIKGDGTKVEVRGFGEMTVDASRMRSLRLFFKYQELFAGLQRATDRLARARREAASIAAPTPIHISPGRTMRAVSAAVAPVTRKPSAKTTDIIEGLANFTIEAREQQRKQTR